MIFSENWRPRSVSRKALSERCSANRLAHQELIHAGEGLGRRGFECVPAIEIGHGAGSGKRAAKRAWVRGIERKAARIAGRLPRGMT